MDDILGQQNDEKKPKPIKAKPGNPRIKELGRDTRFKKGEKPPKGAGRPPKLPSLDLAIARMLEEKKDGLNGVEAIILRLRTAAISGNTKAAQILLDRAYGKATQTVDLTTGGAPLTKDKTAVVTLPDGTVLEI